MNVPDWAPVPADDPVVWQGQPRREVVLRGLAFGVVIAAMVLAVAVFLWRTGEASTGLLAAVLLAALLGLAIPTVATHLWREHTHYLLTDAALYHRTGLVWITVTELGLDKVQNTSYSQGVFGNLFDHGTVTVDTAGSEEPELRLRQMDDPARVHRTIAARTGERSESDHVPGTVAQWRTVRNEVRRLRAVLGSKSSTDDTREM